MLTFVPVSDERFQSVFNKMTDAFPYEERRSLEDQKNCLSDSRFEFYEIADNETAIGFIALWNLNNFIFIEHIAIDEDKRGSGYGSKTLELIKTHYNKSIILEAEEPVTEQQVKRIAFYKNAKFNINDFYYEQPSYHGDHGVPLKILSFPSLLSEEEFRNFIEETRDSAYSNC